MTTSGLLWILGALFGLGGAVLIHARFREERKAGVTNSADIQQKIEDGEITKGLNEAGLILLGLAAAAAIGAVYAGL